MDFDAWLKSGSRGYHKIYIWVCCVVVFLLYFGISCSSVFAASAKQTKIRQFSKQLLGTDQIPIKHLATYK